MTFQYKYTCYICAKEDHDKPDEYVFIFKTNSKKKYQRHWLEHGVRRPCYPGLADLELYGWTAQGKEWESPVNKKADFDRFLYSKDKMVSNKVGPSRGDTEQFLQELNTNTTLNTLWQIEEVKEQIE